MSQFLFYSYSTALSSLTILVWMGCTSPNNVDEITSTELIALAQKNPIQAMRYVESMPTALERDAFIVNTVEQFPRRSKPLCALLSSNVSRERCHRLTERPHLWKPQANHFETISHPPATDRTCSVDPHPNTCWTAQAMTDAQTDWNLALDSCRQIDTDQWRAECFFTLAESIPLTTDSLSIALQTCTYSDAFQKSCWMHIITELSKQSPMHAEDGAWYTLIDTIIRSQVEIPSSIQQDLFEHLLAKSVTKLFEENIKPTKSTPSQLYGHWQNQYAVETLRWCDRPIQHIEEWIHIAEDWSDETESNKTPLCAKRLSKPRGMDLESDLWTTIPLPTNCRAISFLGSSHRIHCENDPHLNWTFALLEASVRLRPNNPIFVQETQNSSNTLLQQRSKQLNDLNWQEVPDQR